MHKGILPAAGFKNARERPVIKKIHKEKQDQLSTVYSTELLVQIIEGQTV